jgi:hypothetical protein
MVYYGNSFTLFLFSVLKICNGIGIAESMLITLSIIWNSNNLETIMLRKLDLFPSSDEERNISPMLYCF